MGLGRSRRLRWRQDDGFRIHARTELGVLLEGIKCPSGPLLELGTWRALPTPLPPFPRLSFFLAQSFDLLILFFFVTRMCTAPLEFTSRQIITRL